MANRGVSGNADKILRSAASRFALNTAHWGSGCTACLSWTIRPIAAGESDASLSRLGSGLSLPGAFWPEPRTLTRAHPRVRCRSVPGPGHASRAVVRIWTPVAFLCARRILVCGKNGEVVDDLLYLAFTALIG